MKIAFKKFLPGITWFFIVLVLMFLPGSDIPEVSWLDKVYFDKWVHAGIFALLVLLFCWPFYHSTFSNKQRLHYFIKIAIVASLLGLVIEFIQKYFTAGRAFEILDWVADSLGALFAFWFCKKKFLKNV